MSRLRRRGVPFVVLVVLVALVALLRDRDLLLFVGLVQAVGVALGLELWRRQGEQLRREQVLVASTRRLAVELGGRAKGDTSHEDEVRSVHGQLRLLDTRTRSLATAAQVDRLAREAAAADLDRDRNGRRDRRNDFAQVEALMNLYSRFPPTGRMPGLRSWAISPDLLLAVIDLVLQRRPRTIVELGGGSSTIWLAHVLRTTGQDARIVTLEHDPFWAERVSDMLVEHGLDHLAEVRLAPLVDHDLAGERWPWYDRAGWEDLTGIGLLFVDGPPKASGELVRFPAIPLLADRLGEDAVVVMDDAIRADEQEIATRWTPLLPDFERLDLPVEKKAIVFSRGPAPVL